ncbi:DoxX family protein [Paenibacillus sp. GCM10027626]|uniref:DoxX family protein n=1 Tax=Paenibacillus sp. GCM10027626 TaxID=3273411 RepID=UPI0036406CE0
MKWFIRILQGLLASVFLMSGLMKVFISSEEIRTLYTETLGYEVGFMRIVGVVESLAAIGLIAVTVGLNLWSSPPAFL